jgi:hypothetical protein
MCMTNERKEAGGDGLKKSNSNLANVRMMSIVGINLHEE